MNKFSKDESEASHQATQGQPQPATDLGSVAPDPKLSPVAFEIISFTDGSEEHGVFGPHGGIKKFGTKSEAEKYAATARAKHEQLVADLSPIAASRSTATPLPPGAARPSMGSAAYRAAMGWAPRKGAQPSPTTGPTPIDLADIPASGVATSGPTGLGAADPKLGPLADALGKAADALTGVANASQGIPLSPVPSKPAPAPPTPSFAKRAIDSLADAMSPVFGKPGDVKGLSDAFKNFRASFARGFGPAPIYPTQPTVGVAPGRQLLHRFFTKLTPLHRHQINLSQCSGWPRNSRMPVGW